MGQYQMKRSGAEMEAALDNVGTALTNANAAFEIADELLSKMNDGSLKGEPGVGISNISKPANPGQPGATDTYTVNLTDGKTYTFSVYNGINGSGNGESSGGGAGVTGASIDEFGNLIIYLSSGSPITVGKVVGDKGDKGDAGVGISGIDNPANPGQPGQTDVYTIQLTDGSSYALKVYNGINGSSDGGDGNGGVGISDIAVAYAKETSATANPTNWGYSMPTDLKQGDYLWTKVSIFLTSSDQPVVYNMVSYIGKDGASGEGGSASGKDGISITNASINSSGELVIYLSEGGPINVGKVVGGKGDKGVGVTGASVDDASGHLIITLSEGGSVDAGKVVGKDGAKGESCTHSWDGTTLTVTSASGTSSADLKGEKGNTGNGITAMYTRYAVGSSATAEPTSGWGSSIPSTFTQGKYLWTKTIVHTNSSSVGTEYNSVSYLGKDGADGQDGSGSVDETSLLQKIYPVGSIYLTFNSANPSTTFGFGTWVRLENRFLIGAGSSYSLGETDGVTHHKHIAPIGYNSSNTSLGTLNINGTTNSFDYTGGYNFVKRDDGGADIGDMSGSYAAYYTDLQKHMPPYLAVYMWRRTA